MQFKTIQQDPVANLYKTFREELHPRPADSVRHKQVPGEPETIVKHSHYK